MERPETLPWTGDDAADRLLAEDPLALLIGMLLDQQITMEKAFRGPYDIKERLGTDLDADHIASLAPEQLEEVFRERPAIHRFPASMAKRTQALCQAISTDYDGNAEAIWLEAEDGKDLLKRLKALPGFGDAKAKIFVGVLGKRLGAAPDGWQDYAADWASIADVATFEDIAPLREAKRLAKEAAKKK